jgi:hypothetical protein
MKTTGSPEMFVMYLPDYMHDIPECNLHSHHGEKLKL